MTNLLALAFLTSPATAGDFLLSATPDRVPSGRDVGGLNWVRVFNNLDDGGWWMTHHFEMAGVPGYNVAPMTEGLELDMSSRVRLAEYANQKDHGIERCPDGSFLHVYSLNFTNDGARAARYSEDWEMQAHGSVEEGVDARAHNDMPVICSEHLQGVAFTNHSDFSATLFEIGPDATVVGTHELDVGGHISGGAFKYDAGSDRFLMTANGEPGLEAIWISRDFEVDERVSFVPIPSLERHYWPQALMRVGDYWLLAFLGVEYMGQYLADDGDVYVAVLNDDFETVDSMKVSNNDDGSGLGSARPSFARHMDQLLVAWDKGFQPYVSVVTLDLVAFGLDEDDSGFVPPEESDADEDGSPCLGDTADDDTVSASSGTDDDGASSTTTGLTGDTADEFDEPAGDEGMKEDPCDEGCGCAHTPNRWSASWLFLVGLVALVRRRA